MTSKFKSNITGKIVSKENLIKRTEECGSSSGFSMAHCCGSKDIGATSKNVEWGFDPSFLESLEFNRENRSLSYKKGECEVEIYKSSDG